MFGSALQLFYDCIYRRGEFFAPLTSSAYHFVFADWAMKWWMASWRNFYFFIPLSSIYYYYYYSTPILSVRFSGYLVLPSTRLILSLLQSVFLNLPPRLLFPPLQSSSNSYTVKAIPEYKLFYHLIRILWFLFEKCTFGPVFSPESIMNFWTVLTAGLPCEGTVRARFFHPSPVFICPFSRKTAVTHLPINQSFDFFSYSFIYSLGVPLKYVIFPWYI